ncbi:MAG: DUF4386 domain-containing protein [Anaerolineae bacterium]|jgi:hypothetical protein|nr:DUF4386 domain-containing protein [Anaerolineae bacterium]
MTNKSLYRTTALLLLIEGLLIFVPVIVLGAAINWPASLDEPANVVLRAIFEQPDATRTGYFAYLIYSILFFPVIVLTARLAEGGQRQTTAVQLAMGFGALSALARSIGIIRWLIAMPALAAAYNASGVTLPTQESIAIVYAMLNDFGGSIGEILGVSMFASLAMAMLAVIIFQGKTLPRWSGFFAIITAASLLIPAFEIFAIDAGIFLTVSVLVFQVWLLSVGVYLFINPPQAIQE